MIQLIWLLVGLATAACPPRQQTMECFYKIADQNNDGVVTRTELKAALNSALHWYEKVPFKLFGGVAKIMKDCDENDDNVLSVEESMRMKTCMDSCFKRRHTVGHFGCK